MSTQSVDQLILTDAELQHLAELRDVLSTAESPGWARIMKRLDELVGEAHEAMLAAGGATDSVLAALTRRWQQREAVVRDIRQYVDDCQTQKTMILQGLSKETMDAEN